ncbi:hypothetical protein [Flammeovirga sp. OC4]|uniref:hypothetical protein n=1 Tax=Flammeovirga sp. OC4 TaxID=1382345 RepID=UPI0005C5F3B0|nr:hypothetical protein [Flammeovirga sp. OC4]
MKSYYSIIRFVNNPLSKENLAIGIILVSKSKVYYKFSDQKIRFSKNINSSNAKLLDYTIKKVSDFIDSEFRKDISLFSQDNSIYIDYLKRLSIYNNGFLQFDNPKALNLEFNSISFENFYQKFIEIKYKKISKETVDKSFENTIKKVFHEPLKGLIDLDYKIKKQEIPNLFFNYTLDGIGVNGSIYSVKSLDLNSEKPIDTFQREISDLESLNYRLDLFSKENLSNPNSDNHYLVVNEYKGRKDSYQKLYEILKSQNDLSFPYSVISTDELPTLTKKIKSSESIIKFSDFIKK